MNIDILFYDMIGGKSISYESLETEALGGTESSIIRLSEAFAKTGHKVAVIQSFPRIESTSPAGVKYLGPSAAIYLKPKNVIHLRKRTDLHKFPESNQVIWMHDRAGTEHCNITDWHEHIGEVPLIGVSKWHQWNLRMNSKARVEFIYPLIDEKCFDHPKSNKFNKNTLVWTASPHKGLKDALYAFSILNQSKPELRLVVTNPGYFEDKFPEQDGVTFCYKVERSKLRGIVSKALAVFYPTNYEETFGMIVAEAEALGTPVICKPIAALKESCKYHFNPQHIPSLQNKRPKIEGQSRFKFESVYKEWLKYLKF